MYTQDSNAIQQAFSSDTLPTLWRVLPLIEDLLTAWEKKAVTARFTLLHEALEEAIEKLKKYYCKFDNIPAILLALCKLI